MRFIEYAAAVPEFVLTTGWGRGVDFERGIIESADGLIICHF